MLRIRKELLVDTKQLENIGFTIPNIYKEASNKSTDYDLVEIIAEKQTPNTFVEIYSNGIIYFNSNGDMDSYDIDFLYELIKLDLVERVDE
jgi:hypothetical protein